MKSAIAAAVGGKELSVEQLRTAFDAMFRGEAGPAQTAALLVALHIKGETPAEIATAARVMRAHSVPVVLSPRPVLLDTCGTGGDGSGSFNISTAAAIVAAACGVPIAKHGNRAATSKAGSADVLEALGVAIELTPEHIARCVDTAGIGFLFARAHHPAMKHVGPVRAQLGVRTLFNFLGPLTNPAGATHQVVGVPEPQWLEVLARALLELGSTRAWVVHGDGGLDEVSLTGPTRVAQLASGEIKQFEVRPEDFGLDTRATGTALQVKDAQHSAALIRAVFGGEQGPARDVVVLNAAAGLHVAQSADSLQECARMAAAAIDSGAASRKLADWVATTRTA